MLAYFIADVYRKIIPKNIRNIIWRIFVSRAAFIKIYLDTVVSRRKFSKYYNSIKPLPYNYPKTVIYMADGKSECGGLSDRLRGMVSVYKLCKSLNMEFKIYFTNPFNLNEYLLPNIYDWTILPDEICYNKKEARPCFIWDYNNNTNSQEFWARHFLREKYKQIHLYTNKIFSEDAEEYGVLFKKLFKPTGELASLIDYHVKILNMGGGGDLSPLLLGLCSYWAILKKMTLCKYIWICQYCRTMKEGF